MFFGGVFAAYMIYRWQYPDGVRLRAASELERPARHVQHVRPAHQQPHHGARRPLRPHRRGRKVGWMLISTIVLGAVFLGIKVVEYYTKFEHNLAPLLNLPFDHARARPRPDADLLRPLLRHDRHPRPPHDHRHRADGLFVPAAFRNDTATATRSASKSSASTGTSSTWSGSSCSRCCTWSTAACPSPAM